MAILQNLRFRVIVREDSIRFTDTQILHNGIYRDVINEDLEEIGYNHHVLNICRNGESVGRIKVPGHSFTYREIMELMFVLEKPFRLQNRDSTYPVFRHLSYVSDHTYSSVWDTRV